VGRPLFRARLSHSTKAKLSVAHHRPRGKERTIQCYYPLRHLDRSQECVSDCLKFAANVQATMRVLEESPLLLAKCKILDSGPLHKIETSFFSLRAIEYHYLKRSSSSL
jgi:hypothetical protein